MLPTKFGARLGAELQLRPESGNHSHHSKRMLLPDGRSALKAGSAPSVPNDNASMTLSPDWLAELRESKQQAIARAQAERADVNTVHQTAEESLRADQSRLAAIVQNAKIESLLQELCTEILHDHPNFVGFSLTRTVRSRAVGSPAEHVEPEPWTGPVENHTLSPEWDLKNGRFVSAVEWKLQSNYHSLHGHELWPLRIAVASTATGIKLEGQTLPAPTAENFKKALLDAFKTALRAFGRRRSHRHHRPWYRRLFKALFPTGELSATLVGGSIVVVLLSTLLAIYLVQIIGLRP